MVNITIVSRFTGELPFNGKTSLKIAGGPLYPAGEVLAVLGGYGEKAVRAWTKKCAKDIQKWSLDAEDLCELIAIALRSGRYLGAEWCVQQPNGPWAACDAYSLIRREWMSNARREMDMEYYIKFAIAKAGNLLLMISCHPPENGR